MKGFIKAITVVILTMFVAISLIIFADADNNYDGFQLLNHLKIFIT